jgi:SAM-dependent methyltransferase
VSDDWEALASWWVGEVVADPAYQADIVPMALDLLGDVAPPVLEIGCGEGQVLRSIPATPRFGCDVSVSLLELAAGHAPVVRCRLPDLGWVRTGVIETMVAVMVLEHVAELETLLREAARCVADGGTLTVVMNHPAYTAPGAGPVVDQSDGEVLWRWGPYFERVASTEPAGAGVMTFHHRPLGVLLTTAATAGWRLQTCDERALGPAAVARAPGLAGQEHIPRLLGLRWARVGD